MTTTDAIVLKTSPYSESTLIVWLLTREEGAHRALAKGARKLKGQTAAAFDMFSVVSAKLRLPQREGLGMLTAVSLKSDWPYLRADLRRLTLASIGMEVLGAVASTSHAEPFFFDEAMKFLTLLEKSEAPGSLTSLLLLRLLHHAGHPPQLEDGLSLDALPAKPVFDFMSGQIRASVLPGSKSSCFMTLTRSLVVDMNPQLNKVPALNSTFSIRGADGVLLLRWLVRIWADHLHQPIHAMEYWEKTNVASK